MPVPHQEVAAADATQDALMTLAARDLPGADAA